MASGASGDELAKNSQPWSKRGYGVVGKRHVMIIASDLPINHPESVEKRPAIELTEGVRTLLERQGVSRSEQTDDISIIKARYNLDRRKTVGGIERSTVEERLKKLEVIEKITKVLHESKEGAGGNYFKLRKLTYLTSVLFNSCYFLHWEWEKRQG